MDNTKRILQKYELLSSLRRKTIPIKKDNIATKTLNEINLIPAIYGGKEVYVDEAKKETFGGGEKKIRVIYF